MTRSVTVANNVSPKQEAVSCFFCQVTYRRCNDLQHHRPPMNNKSTPVFAFKTQCFLLLSSETENFLLMHDESKMSWPNVFTRPFGLN